MNKPKILFQELHIDDRGYVYGVFDNIDAHGIKRTYVLENYSKGMIRAWHGHRKANMYIHIIQGAAKVAAVHMDNPDDLTETVLSARKPALFYVPAGYYNGTMSLVDHTKLLIYSTITLEECKHDDFRKNVTELLP